MKAFRTWYHSKIEKHPLLTKAITAGFLNVGGDAVCQKFENSKSILSNKSGKKANAKFNWKRSLTFFAVGSLYVAPMLHLNYCHILPALVSEKAKYAALKKLAFDQTVFSSFMTCGFFTVINLIEGNNFSKIHNDIKSKFVTTMLVNWQIWIPANFVNFSFMPIQY